jgi:hypothetical protein
MMSNKKSCNKQDTAPEERPKNIYQLRKERALKNLSEYAETLSESVRAHVALTALKNRPKEDSSGKAINVPSHVSDTADRINAWKSRFQAAKTQAKRGRDNKRMGTSSSANTASRPATDSAAGSRGLQTADGDDVTDRSHQPAARDAAAQDKQEAERRPEPSLEHGKEKALARFGHTPDDSGGGSLGNDPDHDSAEPPKAMAIEEKDDKKGGGS